MLKKIQRNWNTIPDIYEIKTKGAIIDQNSLKILPDNINHEEVNEGSITFSKMECL